MNGLIRTKLSVMMFLEFFIWGAWLPPSFGYFGKDGFNFESWQQMLLTMSFPVASIIAMFFANQWADRNFAADRRSAQSVLIFRPHLKRGMERPGRFWYFAVHVGLK